MTRVCIFCRSKNYNRSCVKCIEGFRDWIFESIIFKESIPKGIILVSIGCIFYNCDQYKFTPIRRRVSINEWPGFYCGSGKWKIPQIKVEYEGDVNMQNGCDIISNILEENGIDLYNDIQMQN
jgi:hypothetical protein